MSRRVIVNRDPAILQSMRGVLLLLLLGTTTILSACGGSGTGPSNVEVAENIVDADQYLIGAGDSLQVFVWGHEELSTQVAVRPDGLISTPLVEDIRAAGSTPTALARDIELALSEFVRSPTVTVIVQEFVGEYDRQVRVVGQAVAPTSIPYRSGMTVLDVMIAVGGLSEYAAGNRSQIVRRDSNGEEIVIKVRLKDLLNGGDMRQNVKMRPGDVLIIPESAF